MLGGSIIINRKEVKKEIGMTLLFFRKVVEEILY